MSPQAQKKSAIDAYLTTIIDCLEDSKAENILSIDISEKSSLGDYMIIASGRSHRHVTALADYLLKALKDANIENIRIEGLSNGDWVLIDTNDIIIHLFHPEIREFYNLEKMWLTPETPESKKQKTREK